MISPRACEQEVLKIFDLQVFSKESGINIFCFLLVYQLISHFTDKKYKYLYCNSSLLRYKM